MYGITVVTPPSGLPVSVERLRRHLRLNHRAEDADLAEFLAAAVERFEADTNRPVLQTTYRQDSAAFATPHVLGRGGVTSVTAVHRTLADGTAELVPGSTWRAELTTSPARIVFDELPAGDRGGSVTFVAGWPTADAVPHTVKAAIRLLAAHHYQNREAFQDRDLRDVPVIGWGAVCNAYKLGLSGDWGQG